MPIYAYRCGACGHAKDILQRLSDPVLTVCPACGASAFAKQVTAAGFQLKGSGWYVTDFRDGGKKAGEKKSGDAGTLEATKQPTSGEASAPAPDSAAAGKASATAASSAAPAAPSAPSPTPSAGT